MATITTWMRLEPSLAREPAALDADAAREAEARVHDPLWSLFRQWQLGEFQATDAGSPIIARPVIRSAEVTRFAPKPMLPGAKTKGETLDVGAELLEARVEAEASKPGPLASRVAAEAGQELWASLTDAGLSKFATALLAAFPLSTPRQPDAGAAARWALLGGKVIDGAAVRAAVKKAASPSKVVTVSPAPSASQREKLDTVLADWSTWFDGWVQQPQSTEAWRQEWLDYGFSLGLASDVALTTPGYRSEPSWYAFDAIAGAKLGATEKPEDVAVPALMPTLVRFPGMAASRYWEMEDDEVRLVELLDKGNTLSAAVLDFVLVAGDDWFHVPVTLGTGALHTVTKLEVQDTFGETFSLAALGDYRGVRRFALWRLSGSTTPSLFLPPSSGSRLESAPVEHVELFADELSNLFWACEQRVEGFVGPVDRQTRWPADTAPDAPTPGTPDLEYRLMQVPPPGYFPLMPDGKPGQQKLVPAQVLRVGGGDTTADARVLRDGPILATVIPNGGALTRSYQWARRPDGTMALWVGRSRSPGTTPESPKVAFDRLVPAVRATSDE